MGRAVSLEVGKIPRLENFTAMRDLYFRIGNGFLLMYSVADRATFDETTRWHQLLMETRRDGLRKGGCGPCATLVVGAKCDLRAAERVVSEEEGRALATSLGCGFMECSAKEDTNVDEVFSEVVKEYMRRKGWGAADVFALMVFLCDGFLRLKWRPRTEGEKAVRFFKIARSLPMELQMVLSQRAMQCGRNSLGGKEVDAAFVYLARFYRSRKVSVLEKGMRELLSIFE